MPRVIVNADCRLCITPQTDRYDLPFQLLSFLSRPLTLEK